MTTSPEFRDYMAVLAEMRKAVNKELDNAQVGLIGSDILDAWREVMSARAAVFGQRFLSVEGGHGG